MRRMKVQNFLVNLKILNIRGNVCGHSFHSSGGYFLNLMRGLLLRENLFQTNLLSHQNLNLHLNKNQQLVKYKIKLININY